MADHQGDFGPEDNDLQQLSHDELTRRDVRSLIFHLLYAADAFDYETSLSAIVDNFNRGFDLDIKEDSEVFKIAQAVIDERDTLDTLVRPLLLNWRFERIGLSTKLILRLAFWELVQKQVHPTIVINEAIELSKCFAEKDAYKFVNGILDEAIKTIPEFKPKDAPESDSE